MQNLSVDNLPDQMQVELDRLDAWSRQCKRPHDELLICGCLDDVQAKLNEYRVQHKKNLWHKVKSFMGLGHGIPNSRDIYQRISDIRTSLPLLQNLPNDCWYKVCHFLSCNALLSLAATQKRFFQLINKDLHLRTRVSCYLTVQKPFEILYKEPSFAKELWYLPEDGRKQERFLFFKPKEERKEGETAVFTECLGALRYAQLYRRDYYTISVIMDKDEIQFKVPQPYLLMHRRHLSATCSLDEGNKNKILGLAKAHLCGLEN